MTNPYQIDTGFFDAGVDVGTKYITKSYFLDVYSQLGPSPIASPGLFLMGNNAAGQLGINDIVHRSSPVQTILGGTDWQSVSGGSNFTGAIKTDGTLWMWGYNADGQLGINTWTHRSSPVQIYGGGTNWKSVSCGGSHTGAIKTDGTLWTWGYNIDGQLGINLTYTNKSSPVQTICGGTDWKSVSCGYNFTGAIKADGTLWMWGYNAYGQLATNTRIHRSSPVQTVTGGTNWQSVSCGYKNTGAIKTDGTLWVWGYNSDGQLGTNDIVHRSSPVQTIAGGTNWKSVSCGGSHTGAIKTDGTLWMWGYNVYGNLGTNDMVHRSSPVQTIAGGTNWKSVSCGYNFTDTIKTDGTLWVWGDNTYGQLGTNDRVHRSSPVQTIAGGTNWKSISSDGNTTVGAIAEVGDYFY